MWKSVYAFVEKPLIYLFRFTFNLSRFLDFHINTHAILWILLHEDEGIGFTPRNLYGEFSFQLKLWKI